MKADPRNLEDLKQQLRDRAQGAVNLAARCAKLETQLAEERKELESWMESASALNHKYQKERIRAEKAEAELDSVSRLRASILDNIKSAREQLAAKERETALEAEEEDKPDA